MFLGSNALTARDASIRWPHTKPDAKAISLPAPANRTPGRILDDRAKSPLNNGGGIDIPRVFIRALPKEYDASIPIRYGSVGSYSDNLIRGTR